MNKKYSKFATIYVMFICLFCLVGVAMGQENKSLGNIMPLGDSITAGYIPYGYIPGGYRQKLYSNLTAQGYSFNFVGGHNVYSSATLDAAGQSYHEGHDGYTIQQTIDGVTNSNWLNVDPDIILLHIGANDALKPDAATAPDRLDTLLDEIFNRKPDVRIIVAKIIGGSTVDDNPQAALYDSRIVEYNDAISLSVDARIQAGQDITEVDMYSLLNINNQTNDLGEQLFTDISHPTQVGYDLMGNAWTEAIVTVPEPVTMSLLVVAGITTLLRRRKK